MVASLNTERGITSDAVKAWIYQVLSDTADGRLGGNLLGVYLQSSNPDAEEFPAICVGKTPANLKVFGLEVIVPVLPRSPVISSYQSTETSDSQIWDISLTQRIPKAGEPRTLITAVQRLKRIFADFGAYVIPIPQTDLLGNYEGATFSFKIESFID